jgi:hypothetical protein
LEEKVKKSWKIYIFSGWQIRAPHSILEHKSHVSALFQPNIAYQQKISSFSSLLRQDTDVLVGLVMRREDYKQWKNGIYYYSVDEYASLARHFTSLVPHCRVRFFVCSIDDEECGPFEGLSFVFRSGHPIENLYTLASCDFLLSPPSTYAMWAAFVGNIPIYLVAEPNKAYSLADFIAVNG